MYRGERRKNSVLKNLCVHEAFLGSYGQQGVQRSFCIVQVRHLNLDGVAGPVQGVCYGAREGRGRREKGRSVARGARGARRKHVGTLRCGCFVIRF